MKALGREPAAAANAIDGRPIGAPVRLGDVEALRVHNDAPSDEIEGLSKVASEVRTRKCG
jgi:hypothetical protein